MVQRFLRGVQCWRCCKSYLEGIEVIQYSTVLGDIILKSSESHLGVRQLAIKQITTMAFINDDAVILIDGWRGCVFRGVQQALHHTLHRGDMHGGVAIRSLFIQLLNAKGVGKRLEVFHARVFEGICGLFAESGTVDQKQNTSKTLGFEQAID